MDFNYTQKGLIAMTVVIVLCLIAGISSSIFWKRDNPIEEVAEEVIDVIAEKELNLPPGSVNIDLTPGDKEEAKK